MRASWACVLGDLKCEMHEGRVKRRPVNEYFRSVTQEDRLWKVWRADLPWEYCNRGRESLLPTTALKKAHASHVTGAKKSAPGLVNF
jgi:hypothetical protein